MRAHDREVGGLRCTDVLEHLPDYLDGTLPADRVARVEAHLAGCDWCERFGGDYADVVRALRARLGAPTAPPGVHDRLMERLRSVTG